VIQAVDVAVDGLASHRDGNDAGQQELGGFAPHQVRVGTQGFAEQVEPDLGLAAVAEGGVLAQQGPDRRSPLDIDREAGWARIGKAITGFRLEGGIEGVRDAPCARTLTGTRP